MQGSGTPPAAATIFFGANDAALLGRNSEKQHVPIGEYKDNLRRIVYHLKVQSCLTRYFEIFFYAHSIFIHCGSFICQSHG